MLECPWPHAMSATRAGGSASSRSWISGAAGSHSLPSRFSNMGREGSLALVQVLAVVGVWHALPRAERFEQLIDGTHRGQDRASERRDVVEARNVEQRLLVPRRDREPPLSTVLFGREQVACRLMLEPLARV